MLSDVPLMIEYLHLLYADVTHRILGNLIVISSMHLRRWTAARQRYSCHVDKCTIIGKERERERERDYLESLPCTTAIFLMLIREEEEDE